jgi:hypothetical protein
MSDRYEPLPGWPEEPAYEPPPGHGYPGGYRPVRRTPDWPPDRDDLLAALLLQNEWLLSQQVQQSPVPARRGPDPWTVVGWAVAGAIGTGVLLAVAVVAVAVAVSAVSLAVAAGILYMLLKTKG